MENVLNQSGPALTPEALSARYASHIAEIALSFGSNCILFTLDGVACRRADPAGVSSDTALHPLCPYFRESCNNAILSRSAEIFACPAGYLFIAAPLYSADGADGVIFIGPLSYSDTLKCQRPEGGICSPVRRTTRARAEALAHLLNIVSSEISDRDAAERLAAEKRFGARMEIMAEAGALQRAGHRDEYPVSMEETLSEAILMGDTDKAKSYINRLLSYVFYAKGTAERHNIILIRLLELLTIISRSAIRAGADTAFCLDLNASSVTEAIRLFRSDTRIEDIAVWLSEVLEKYTAVLTDLGTTRHADMLSTVKNYMLTNYMHKLTLEDVAELVFITPTYLSKIFKKEVGMPFIQYLNTIRVEQSKYLLLYTDKPITEIYSLTGFEDQSYFTKVFRSIVGISPGRFRETAGRV